VAWGAALRDGIFPARFEPAEFVEAHKHRIKRAGGNAGLARDGVAVMPMGGTSEESLEDGEGLVGGAKSKAH